MAVMNSYTLRPGRFTAEVAIGDDGDGGGFTLAFDLEGRAQLWHYPYHGEPTHLATIRLADPAGTLAHFTRSA